MMWHFAKSSASPFQNCENCFACCGLVGNTHYMRRIQENFAWLFFQDGEPDDSRQAVAEITQVTFWDEVVQKPFQIQADDLAAYPLPNTHYMTTCAKSGVTIETNWPAEFDQRVLSEEEYLKIVR